MKRDWLRFEWARFEWAECRKIGAMKPAKGHPGAPHVQTKGLPPGLHLHAMPALSPVLEERSPLSFQGNVVDAETPTTASASEIVSASADVCVPAAEVPADWFKQRKATTTESRFKEELTVPVERESAEEPVETGFRSRVSMMVTQFRSKRSTERAPSQIILEKPAVQVKGLPHKATKSKSKFSLNPLNLFAKLRDSYIHLMNGVATSGMVASGPVGDSSAQQSTLFFSREMDKNAVSQIRELERNDSQADAEYRQLQAMAFPRNSSKVKPFVEPLPQRSKSTRSYPDLGLFSSSRSGRGSGRRFSGELPRSKSNGLSDEVYFNRKLRGSKKNKPHINPYADDDWKASAVARGPKPDAKQGSPSDFQFQRERRNAGTDAQAEFRLQQSASTGSLFKYTH